MKPSPCHGPIREESAQRTGGAFRAEPGQQSTGGENLYCHALDPARLWLSVALVLGLAGAGAAQQAGYRDLTISWRAPEDHIPTPSSALCPSVRSTVSDGDPRQSPAAPGKPGDKLEFTVRQIVPSELHIGDDFTATVRLKNVGVTQVPIPWQTDGEQVVRVSKDGKQEIYEVADVAFRLKTGDKKRAPMFLQSEGALFAHPDDHANYLALAPGRWVDIKLKGAVVCGLADCLIEAEADDHARAHRLVVPAGLDAPRRRLSRGSRRLHRARTGFIALPSRHPRSGNPQRE